MLCYNICRFLLAQTRLLLILMSRSVIRCAIYSLFPAFSFPCYLYYGLDYRSPLTDTSFRRKENVIGIHGFRGHIGYPFSVIEANKGVHLYILNIVLLKLMYFFHSNASI